MAPTARFSTCSVPDCARPGVRGGSCNMCKRHLCIKHRSKQYHQCPSPSELTDEEWDKAIDDEIADLLSRVNVTQLEKAASRLNDGKSCVFEPGKHRGDGAIMGCANYHAWLVFEDGERWLSRIPRDAFTDLPPDLIEYIISSEYATLKFLEGTSVPAPQVFGYALASDPSNLVGVTYLLIQALPGKPYQEYLATPEQTARVLEQFADIMIELGKHPLGHIGSLTPVKTRKAGCACSCGESVEVGPLASNRFLHLDHTLGPFSTAAEYCASVAQAYLDILADSQLVQSDAEAARQFYEAVRDNASIITTLSAEDESSYLKHVDDKGDHLLVDEDYNIVGIIDWQFARVVPAAEAFGPSLLTADMGILYAGAESGSPTAGDKILTDALRKKEGSDCHRTRDLARVMAVYMDAGSSGSGGNNLMRRIQFGIPAGSSAEETKQVVATLLSELEKLKKSKN